MASVFHAGGGAFSWMHCTAIGLCTAAITASWSGEALCATARTKPSSGIQISPVAIRLKRRSLRVRRRAIKDILQPFRPRPALMRRCTRATSPDRRAPQQSPPLHMRGRRG